MPQQAAVSKPPSVVAAMRRNDKPFLSESGRKGAMTTNRQRSHKILLELRVRAEQANEHICPPD